jgi:hypothetical protein
MTSAPRIPAVALAVGGLIAAAAAHADGSFASRLNQVRSADGSEATVAPASVSDGPVAFDASPFAGPVLSTTSAGVSYMRYRPRSSRRYEDDNYYRSPKSQTYLQLQGGFFDPDGEPGKEGLGSFRLGALVDPHVSIGGMVDWSHRGESDATIVSEVPGPGGGPPITTELLLAKSSIDLVPILAYLQFSGDGRTGIVPYAGIGGGYELLFLKAEDPTGVTYDQTFGGWGWQAWAGLGIPLSRDARITGEVFRNGGDLSHDSDDPSTGYTIRETVNVNGTGARFGVAFSF